MRGGFDVICNIVDVICINNNVIEVMGPSNAICTNELQIIDDIEMIKSHTCCTRNTNWTHFDHNHNTRIDSATILDDTITTDDTKIGTITTANTKIGSITPTNTKIGTITITTSPYLFHRPTMCCMKIWCFNPLGLILTT